jgi:hypothetical protein
VHRACPTEILTFDNVRYRRALEGPSGRCSLVPHPPALLQACNFSVVVMRTVDTVHLFKINNLRSVLRDLGLTSNQVWGLTKTDQEWSEKLDTALTATRRDDLDHGTNAAYVRGCVCSECRAHQRIRMARNRC